MNNLGEIKRIIYNLKRQYGMPITYYYLISATVNDETGVRTPTYGSFTVKKAIRCIEKQSVDFLAGLKSFGREPGALFKGIKIIVDSKDLPSGFTPKKGHVIEFDSKSYEIEEIDIADHKYAYEFTLKDAQQSITVGA